MCTVTFVPQDRAFLLAMNRDDSYRRSKTNPPAIHASRDVNALYPSEPAGGTWIAANEFGFAFALLNWNVPSQIPKLRSRGEIIPALAHASTLEDAATILKHLSLQGICSFRLIILSAREQRAQEFRWNGTLSSVDLPWQHQHWFSSGLSDEDAANARGRVCQHALAEADVHTVNWVRRLHRSHSPETGPFSICVHRENAGTLSYTEIAVSAAHVTMRYKSASACSEEGFLTAELSLRPISASAH